MPVTVTNNPDRSRSEYDTDTNRYRLYNPDGLLAEDRALTGEEADAADAAVADSHERTDLEAAALGAYTRNDEFIALAAVATYPLSMGAQRALVDQVAHLSRVQNGIIRLLHMRRIINPGDD